MDRRLNLDEENYGELTAQLDAREILRYLNYLGIHNISGEVLKYFITDLKKLIKYDLQQKNQLGSSNCPKRDGPERLHSASTFSSRSRSKAYNGAVLCCNRECQRPKKPFQIQNIHSAPNLGQKTEEKEQLSKRACSCIRVERKTDSLKEPSKTTITLSDNLIKVPKPQPKKKCDPVSLYHYYSSLWEKYKPNVPGENDWADIRWRIRQKMVGVDTQPSSKTTVHHKKNKENKNTS